MWGCSLFCQQHKQILFTEVYVIDIIKKKNTTNSFDKDDLSFAYFFLLKVMRIVHHFKNDSYFLTLNQWPRNFSWAILKVIQRLMWCMWQIFSFCFLYVYGCHGLGSWRGWCDVSDICLLFVLSAAPSPDNWELHNINQASLDSINYINSQKWSWYLLKAQSSKCSRTWKIVKTFSHFCVYNSYTVCPIHIQMH